MMPPSPAFAVRILNPVAASPLVRRLATSANAVASYVYRGCARFSNLNPGVDPFAPFMPMALRPPQDADPPAHQRAAAFHRDEVHAVGGQFASGVPAVPGIDGIARRRRGVGEDRHDLAAEIEDPDL